MTSKDKTKGPRRLHIVMQGKGGAGKSFVSSLLCQSLMSRDLTYRAIDLDPVNRSLAAIASIKAEAWDIMGEGLKQIIPKRFDDLVESLVDGEGTIVIDTGATSFIPFNSYLIEQKIPALLQKYALETNIHCVIRGGASLHDCLRGLSEICELHDPTATNIYVWLNEVEGKIESQGKTFEQMKVYDKDRISGIITIPEQRNELFRGDMQNMLKRQLTFEDAIQSKDFGIVSKSRLEQLREYFTSSVSIHV